MEEIKIDIEPEIYLDEDCSHCEHKDFDEICPYCDGVGFVPTDAGKAILELIKRYK